MPAMHSTVDLYTIAPLKLSRNKNIKTVLEALLGAKILLGANKL